MAEGPLGSPHQTLRFRADNATQLLELNRPEALALCEDFDRLANERVRLERENALLRKAVGEWLNQAADCDLGTDCNCVGHDDVLIMQMEDALSHFASTDQEEDRDS